MWEPAIRMLLVASAEVARRRPRPEAFDIPAGVYDPIRTSWKISPAAPVPLFHASKIQIYWIYYISAACDE